MGIKGLTLQIAAFEFQHIIERRKFRISKAN